MQLIDAQRFWLERNVPFVSFRFPEEAQITTFAGGYFSESKNQDKNPCFVIAPFDIQTHSLLFYHPAHLYTGDDAIIIETDGTKKSANSAMIKKPFVASKSEYLHQADRLIGEMKDHHFRKIVLSRVIKQPLTTADLPTVFESMCKKYPGAFVYFLNDGNNQCWMGASPELLIDFREGKARTVALAGTQKLDNSRSSSLVWGSKEIEEQDMVSEFIKEHLIGFPVENLKVSEPETHIAGHLAHLITIFTWESSFNEAIKLKDLLHPTPAVCGLPRNAAFQRIKETELHQRNYYTGYLGLLDESARIKLFVNLRCMQIIDNEAYIYVGGGLTSSSSSLAEWEETQAKAQTLLSVFPK